MQRHSALFNVKIHGKSEEKSQRQKKLLEKGQGSEEIHISWRRRISDVSQLCSGNDDEGEYETTVENRSLPRAGKSADRHTLEGERAKKLKTFGNEVQGVALRVCLG